MDEEFDLLSTSRSKSPINQSVSSQQQQQQPMLHPPSVSASQLSLGVVICSLLQCFVCCLLILLSNRLQLVYVLTILKCL